MCWQILTSLIKTQIALRWQHYSLLFLLTWTGRQTKVYFTKEEINSRVRDCTITFPRALCRAGRKWVRREGGLLSAPPPRMDTLILSAGAQDCQSRSSPTVGESKSILKKEEESYPIVFYLWFDSFFPTGTKITHIQPGSKNVLTQSSIEWLLALGRMLLFYYWLDYLE